VRRKEDPQYVITLRAQWNKVHAIASVEFPDIDPSFEEYGRDGLFLSDFDLLIDKKNVTKGFCFYLLEQDLSFWSRVCENFEQFSIIDSMLKIVLDKSDECNYDVESVQIVGSEIYFKQFTSLVLLLPGINRKIVNDFSLTVDDL